MAHRMRGVKPGILQTVVNGKARVQKAEVTPDPAVRCGHGAERDPPLLRLLLEMKEPAQSAAVGVGADTGIEKYGVRPSPLYTGDDLADPDPAASAVAIERTVAAANQQHAAELLNAVIIDHYRICLQKKRAYRAATMSRDTGAHEFGGYACHSHFPIRLYLRRHRHDAAKRRPISDY